jgi:hypothetical protein
MVVRDGYGALQEIATRVPLRGGSGALCARGLRVGCVCRVPEIPERAPAAGEGHRCAGAAGCVAAAAAAGGVTGVQPASCARVQGSSAELKRSFVRVSVGYVLWSSEKECRRADCCSCCSLNRRSRELKSSIKKCISACTQNA